MPRAETIADGQKEFYPIANWFRRDLSQRLVRFSSSAMERLLEAQRNCPDHFYFDQRDTALRDMVAMTAQEPRRQRSHTGNSARLVDFVRSQS